MLTKLKIAKKLANSGISVHLANGFKENILIKILTGKDVPEHTWFEPAPKLTSDVKKWIAYSDGFTKGEVVVNEGASQALTSSRAVSLLPVGIVRVDHDFKKGDLIKIVDESGNTIGLGKAQYGSDKLEPGRSHGKQKALVHYDYLYLENVNTTH